MDNKPNTNILYPMVALRGVAVYPNQLASFDVEREISLSAIKKANAIDRLVFVAMQKDTTIDIPEPKDINEIGTVCRIRQLLQLNNNGLSRVMVEGLYRGKAVDIKMSGSMLLAEVEKLEDRTEKVSVVKKEALMRSAVSLFEEYLHQGNEFVPEQMINLMANPDPSYIADFIAQTVPFAVNDKQSFLEELRPCKRLESISKILNRELNIMSLEKELSDAANESLSQTQREYFLKEEMRIIQDELAGGTGEDEISQFREKIDNLPVDDEIKERLLKHVNHLAKEPFGSAEASVTRSYIETCLEIPFGKKTKETRDVSKAKKILDHDHYGLDKVKERILEYLAVRQLSPEIKGGLICLVGPPGTGKTSVAQSIARATNRKLVRISLGGVHDEAEIRGHRKTYIGSMPGRIMDGVIKSKVCNPLIVMDEIDKLGADYKGDPASALLEVFDGEQNVSFRDNFLEIPFDLSDVFFITTANTLDTIPRALLDRMEIIELNSYTDEEKKHIAKKYLIPKQREKHGLKASQISISNDALNDIISSYTKESGVRVLERTIAKLCRKAAAYIANGEGKTLNIKKEDLEKLLGPATVKPEEQREEDTVGIVRGLAWTEAGGEVLDCEAAVCDGTGKLEITGNLGDVMKESVRAAVTCIRTRASKLGIDPDFYKDKDIHIHFPEGAVPKDGPSAGVTVTTAIISALASWPVHHDIAMTGEITLRGRVLAIGGLKEKTMAALRNNVKTVIIPASNEPDLAEIDQDVRKKLNFVFARDIDDVIAHAFDKNVFKETKCPQLTSTKLNSLNPQQIRSSSSTLRVNQ